MFCPNCGQQQVSDNTKFCPRCGIAITGLSEWLAGSGAAAARAFVMRNIHTASQVPASREAAPLESRSVRLKGIKRGAKVMFLSGVLAPVFFGLSFIADSPGPLLVPLCIFLAGLSLLLYAHLFGEESSPDRSQQVQPSRFEAPMAGAALRPASNMGINHTGGEQIRTRELVQPPSITEHTTRLLDND